MSDALRVKSKPRYLSFSDAAPGRAKTEFPVSNRLSNLTDDNSRTTAQYDDASRRRRDQSRCPSQTWSPTACRAGIGEGGYSGAVVVAFASLVRAWPVPKRILIVDDNQTVREILRLFLRSRAGLEVCGEAADGLEALELVSHLAPDLILLDMAMPGMNGLQTARQMRIMLVGSPIILFTNYSDAIRPDVIKASGINAAVSKSNVKELLKRIESLLGAGPKAATA